MDAATSLTDLGAIRGNRLEALKSDRAGQHSIRINDTDRIQKQLQRIDEEILPEKKPHVEPQAGQIQ